MKFSKSTAEVFIPDGMKEDAALERTTHLCIGSHQDDIEIMAYHGIAQCFGRQDRWMTGVVATDGAGSSRTGIYGDFTDEEMQKARQSEQRKAAYVGEYAAQIQLDYTSSEVKDPSSETVIEDLYSILQATSPSVIYLHNPADKHDTHVGLLLRSLEALRRLPSEQLPSKVYGCEVWRDLDWLVDEDKAVLNVSDYPNVAASLVGIFDSQISGGKRYDLATAGRRLANATYFAAHETDQASALTFALDLTRLVEEKALSVSEFVAAYIDRFHRDVRTRLEKLGG